MFLATPTFLFPAERNAGSSWGRYCYCYSDLYCALSEAFLSAERLLQALSFSFIRCPSNMSDPVSPEVLKTVLVHLCYLVEWSVSLFQWMLVHYFQACRYISWHPFHCLCPWFCHCFGCVLVHLELSSSFQANIFICCHKIVLLIYHCHHSLVLEIVKNKQKPSKCMQMWENSADFFDDAQITSNEINNKNHNQ